MTVTVQELIEELKKMDPEAIVIMSKDAEGNNFSPLYATSDKYFYQADTTYSGSISKTKEGKKAFVLWPTN